MGYQLDFWAIADYLGLLLYGAATTLALTAIAATLGIALSIAGAATARWGIRWARALIAAYVELIRNTPFHRSAILHFLWPAEPWVAADCDASRDPGHDGQSDRLCIEICGPGSKRCRPASAKPAWHLAFRRFWSSSKSSCPRHWPTSIRPWSARSSSRCWNPPSCRRSPSPI